jgi:hypothetical protein
MACQIGVPRFVAQPFGEGSLLFGSPDQVGCLLAYLHSGGDQQVARLIPLLRERTCMHAPLCSDISQKKVLVISGRPHPEVKVLVGQRFVVTANFIIMVGGQTK